MAAGFNGGTVDNGGERALINVTGATALAGNPTFTVHRTPGGSATPQNVSIQGQNQITIENFLDTNSNPVFIRDGEVVTVDYTGGLTDSGGAVGGVNGISLKNTSRRSPKILGGDWFHATQDLGGDGNLGPAGEGEGEFAHIVRTDTGHSVALVQFTGEDWAWPVTLQIGVPYRFDVFEGAGQRVVKSVSFQQ